MPVVRGVEFGCHGNMSADPKVAVGCREDMFGCHGDE